MLTLLQEYMRHISKMIVDDVDKIVDNMPLSPRNRTGSFGRLLKISDMWYDEEIMEKYGKGSMTLEPDSDQKTGNTGRLLFQTCYQTVRPDEKNFRRGFPVYSRNGLFSKPEDCLQAPSALSPGSS